VKNYKEKIFFRQVFEDFSKGLWGKFWAEGIFGENRMRAVWDYKERWIYEGFCLEFPSQIFWHCVSHKFLFYGKS